MRALLIALGLLVAVILASGRITRFRASGDQWMLRQRSMRSFRKANASRPLKGDRFQVDVHKRLLRGVQFVHFPRCGEKFKSTVLLSSSVCAYLANESRETADACVHVGLKALETKNLLYQGDEARGVHECCRLVGGSHEPFKPPRAPETASSRLTAAMFCDPVERVTLSAFPRELKEFSARFRRLVLDPLANTRTSDGLATFSSLRSVQNCYTKVLTGHWCDDQVSSDLLDLSGAIFNLRRLDFIGLTSQWNASVCLFHEEFGLGPVDWDREGQNTRPGAYPANMIIPADLRYLVHSNEKLDAEIYFEATGLFVERVARFPLCADMMVFDSTSGLITSTSGW